VQIQNSGIALPEELVYEPRARQSWVSSFGFSSFGFQDEKSFYRRVMAKNRSIRRLYHDSQPEFRTPFMESFNERECQDRVAKRPDAD